MVRIPDFHSHGPGSIPGQGTGEGKKKKKEIVSSNIYSVFNIKSHNSYNYMKFYN